MEINGYRVHLLKRTANCPYPPDRIWWKQHKVRATEDDKPMDRTLFVYEIPHFLKIKPNLQTFLSQFGDIENVFLNTPPRSLDRHYSPFEPVEYWECDSAHVVFKKAKYLRKVLNLSLSDPLIVSKDGKDLKTTQDAYEDSRLFDLEAALKKAEENMKQYALQQRAAEDAKAAAKESEDGWVTVSKKYKPVESKTASRKKIRARSAKKTKMQLVNFYAFQERERKAKAFKNNTREWQESLEKIAQMRQERKFKPL